MTTITDPIAFLEGYVGGNEHARLAIAMLKERFIQSESVRTVTYHGSGEDLATDVHGLLDAKERNRFMTKWREREAKIVNGLPTNEDPPSLR